MFKDKPYRLASANTCELNRGKTVYRGRDAGCPVPPLDPYVRHTAYASGYNDKARGKSFGVAIFGIFY